MSSSLIHRSPEESPSISRNKSVVVYRISADYIEYDTLFEEVELRETLHSSGNQKSFAPFLTRLIAKAKVLAIT